MDDFETDIIPENIEGRIIKEGPLDKQGGARGGLKTWKHRWFVLRRNFLTYYRVKPPRKEENGKIITMGEHLLGVFPLDKAKILLEDDTSLRASVGPEIGGTGIGFTKCGNCKKELTIWKSKHKCVSCGLIYCSSCTRDTKAIPKASFPKNTRICVKCLEKMTTDRKTREKSTKKGTLMDRAKAKLETSPTSGTATTSPGEARDVLPDTEDHIIEKVPKTSRASSMFEFGRSRKFAFAIKSSERVLWLNAETDTDRQSWIAALREAIDSLSKRKTRADEGISQAPQWEIDFKELEISEKIGDGAFGEVFKGRLWGTDVAIKQFKAEKINQKVLNDLKKEVLSSVNYDIRMLFSTSEHAQSRPISAL